jgi:hypothetical protein
MAKKKKKKKKRKKKRKEEECRKCLKKIQTTEEGRNQRWV